MAQGGVRIPYPKLHPKGAYLLKDNDFGLAAHTSPSSSKCKTLSPFVHVEHNIFLMQSKKHDNKLMICGTEN